LKDLQRIGTRNRARSRAIGSALAVAAAVCGCSTGSPPGVPVACKESPAAIQSALAKAPGDVRVGGSRLSECFARGGDQADAEALGLSFLPAERSLAAGARAHPRGPDALRLGFLIGAARRGQSRAPIYGELAHRIESELGGVDVGSPRFRAGERAGRARG
jgi:hypothetical protein